MSNRSNNSDWRIGSTLTFSGGVDASNSPSFLNPNEIAFATNAQFRGGMAKPRPGIRKLNIPLSHFATGVETPFKQGRFQHASFYNGNGIPMLLSSHGGRIFKLDITTMMVSEITPSKPSPTSERHAARTSADFVVPLVGNTVTVDLEPASGFTSDSSDMSLTYPDLVIANEVFTLTGIGSPTQIVVRNNSADLVGKTIKKPASIVFDKVLTPATPTMLDPNPADPKIGWSVQAENYWIYQDNISLPIIFDGSTARRSMLIRSEVPIGNVMCYTMGRISVALTDRNSYRVGDIVFGSSGSPSLGYKDSILRFTENDYLNEGGDFVARIFGAPSNAGPITAMKPVSMMDTQLGQGPMLVGTYNDVFTVNLPFDRTTWKNTVNPLQTVTPVNGPLGQRSMVSVNTDMWYRGIDGIRSFIMARRDFNTWGNTPMSTEVSNVLSFDDFRYLEHGSGELFDNRIIHTCSPVDSPMGVWHRGMVSIDLDLISGIGKNVPPAWEGLWVGPRILQLVKATIENKERLFIYGLDENDEIAIYEMMPTDKFDNSADRILWTLDMPSYNCGDADQFKKLETGRIVLESLTGQLDATVRYRSDLNACWQPWDAFTVCATREDCAGSPTAPDCTGPHTYLPQTRSPMRLRTPDDGFDSQVSGHRWNTGYQFQPRIILHGYAEVKQVRIYCQDATENLGTEKRESMSEECVAKAECCDLNLFAALST